MAKYKSTKSTKYKTRKVQNSKVQKRKKCKNVKNIKKTHKKYKNKKTPGRQLLVQKRKIELKYKRPKNTKMYDRKNIKL